MYQRMFDSLRSAGARITEGQPASDDDVAAISARAGTALPDDYVTFLRELGAARVVTELPGMAGDLRFVGHAPDDEQLDVRLAIDALPRESERWGQPARPAVPVLLYGVAAGARGETGSECYVVHDAAVHHYHRGQLEPRGSFRELVRSWLREVLDRLEALEERREKTRELVAALRALVPRELVSAASDDEHLVLRRAADGVEVTLSVGSWRGSHGANDGLVLEAVWDEPGMAGDDAIDAWNRRARLARASAASPGARCSARIHLEGLDPARALAALAHDARLTIHELHPSRPDLDAIAARLAESPPTTAEERLLHTMFGQRPGAGSSESEPSFRRLGEALVGMSTRGLASHRTPVPVRITVGPTGLVEIVHERPFDGARADALALATRVAAEAGGVRVTATEGAMVFTQLTSDAIVGTEAFTELMNELEDVVARAR